MPKNLWGGRFQKGMHPLLKRFSFSLEVDSELFEAEVCVNEAWVKMLRRIGLVTVAEQKRLLRGLRAVGRDFQGSNFQGKAIIYEDVHTLVQSSLEKKIGDLAKKIHTGRSRNDLVITSTRVYLRDRISEIMAGVRKLQQALVTTAKRSRESIIPGMTHLKKAQPILVAHHFLAYVEMMEEDHERLEGARKRCDILPLGSAALSGSSLPIDQRFLARALGFSRISTNSITAVSDRAFLCEFLSALSILWMHLSRLSEDMILWNSEAFQYIDLDDAFATGSSLMPQKKNPDVFELIRGRSGVIFGYLQALLTVQKGLPLAYNRDLQEDKPGLFDAIRKTEVALELLPYVFNTLTFHPESMELAMADDGLYATDILEHLVQKGLSHREAHDAVGRAVRYSIDAQKPMRDFTVQEWKRFSKKFDSEIYDLFDERVSVESKKTIGSTNPQRVKNEIQKWEKVFRRKKT